MKLGGMTQREVLEEAAANAAFPIPMAAPNFLTAADDQAFSARLHDREVSEINPWSRDTAGRAPFVNEASEGAFPVLAFEKLFHPEPAASASPIAADVIGKIFGQAAREGDYARIGDEIQKAIFLPEFAKTSNERSDDNEDLPSPTFAKRMKEPLTYKRRICGETGDIWVEGFSADGTLKSARVVFE